MSLTARWPRTSCVYCGGRIRSDTRRPSRNPLLACSRHLRLPRLDPEYMSAYDPRMHAADDREAVTPTRERDE